RQITSKFHQPLRQVVWAIFLEECCRCGHRQLEGSFQTIWALIFGELHPTERVALTELQYAFQVFWSSIGKLAAHVELDGKSDLVAVNAVLRMINQPSFPSKYQPSGRL